MKKSLITIIIICFSVIVNAQENQINNSSYDLGDGISFSFNEGNYLFNVYGFIRPAYIYNDILSNAQEVTYKEISRQFKFKNSNLFIEGRAFKEKISFTIQMDYSISKPLVEAFIEYQLDNSTTIYFGQRQVQHNNLEMVHDDNALRFTDRGLLSQNYTQSGEEFGIFIESSFGDKFIIEPKLAVTSGDGGDSFGENLRNIDIGGVKLGSRLNLYPLGAFSDGNEITAVDLIGEENLKIQLGLAYSKSFEVSNSMGDGHGDFLLYDSSGNYNLPDYSQLFFDLLLKYKGFSFLFEYADSYASSLNQVYTDENASNIFISQQISEYLILGDSYNVHLGYMIQNGFGVDLRYEMANPEFDMNTESLLQSFDSYGLGISKYLKGNNLKMQLGAYKVDFDSGNEITYGEFLVQIAF
ncbi:MAG TPA: hypothetical protein EYQ79_00220 [Flavobacteriaceae bacterium]|jgi:hypothetical protein|nr:hypothetical protein [Flavobacteriaceae bacterium]